jgi:hypothetical protein
VIINALAAAPDEVSYPKFSGKSDAYVWFVVHATPFLAQGGRLSFVVSSALLFSDYGIPLIRFLARHYRIRAVVDSMVERWFPDADTNTVLLLLEREKDATARQENVVRFVRLRRPLSQLLPLPDEASRRQRLEDLVEIIVGAPDGDDDPRMRVNIREQGPHGALSLDEETAGEDLLDDDEDDE